MTQKPGSTKGFNIVGAISDTIILLLLIGGAGFGGYFYGVHQKLAPVQNVPPGTPGATAAVQATLPPPKSATPEVAKPRDADNTASEKVSDTSADSHDHVQDNAVPTKSKIKYWIASSGADYIGYSITVKVNDTPVDNFFGPGKSVDITSLVKPGDNSVVFDAKALGDQYNKHAGDKKAVLTVQIVKGPSIKEDFKSSDVVLTTKRTAAETEDFNDSQHFTGE